MDLTGYAEDLSAINRYILAFDTQSKPPITSHAKELQDSWIKWYGNLSWSDQNLVKQNWIDGRKRRDEFNIAMGYVTPQYSIPAEQMNPNGVPGAGLAQTYQSGSAVSTFVANNFAYFAITVAALSVVYLAKK
jgi:hypothetical protein